MHVDVTGDDNARRAAKEKKNVNTVFGANKHVVYTVEPLFVTLNAAMLKKILTLTFLVSQSQDTQKKTPPL